MYPDPFKEELDSGFYCDALLASNQNRHLRKAIKNHKNTFISLLGGWEAQHVVHLDGFPRLVRSRKRGVQAMFLSGWFGYSAGSARPNILVDLLSKFQPVEMFL
jgi:hypothetical protein